MNLLLAFLGFCAGSVIASAVVALIISLGVVPRYAALTRTAGKIRLYEDCSILGAFVGNLFYLYQGNLPFGLWGVGLFGLASGFFLGGWIVALGEVVNIYAILIRRLGLTWGLGLLILTMAIAKTLGSLLYFWKGWWM